MFSTLQPRLSEPRLAPQAGFSLLTNKIIDFNFGYADHLLSGLSRMDPKRHQDTANGWSARSLTKPEKSLCPKPQQPIEHKQWPRSPRTGDASNSPASSSPPTLRTSRSTATWAPARQDPPDHSNRYTRLPADDPGQVLYRLKSDHASAYRQEYRRS